MFFKTIINCIKNLDFYTELSKNTLKQSIKYSLSLTMLCALIFNIIFGSMINYDIIKPLKTYIDNVPDFELSNYGLSIHSNKNLIVTKNNYAIEINDTVIVQDLIDKYENKNLNTKILIAKDGFLLEKANSKPNLVFFQDVNQLKGITLTNEDFYIIKDYINYAFLIMIIIFLILTIIISLISTLFRSLMYSIFLTVISEVNGFTIPFKDCYKISLYATTFYILFWTPVVLLPVPINLVIKSIILHLVSMLYLYLICKKNNSNSNSN